MTVVQVSSNTAKVFSLVPEEVLHKRLEELLEPFQVEKIRVGLAEDSLDYINPIKIWVKNQANDYLIFDRIFHRNTDGFLILELEPAISQENIPFLSFYNLARASINQLQVCAISVKLLLKRYAKLRVLIE